MIMETFSGLKVLTCGSSAKLLTKIPLRVARVPEASLSLNEWWVHGHPLCAILPSYDRKALV